MSLERLNHIHHFDHKTGVATMGPAVLVQQVLDKILVPFSHCGTIGGCSGVAEGGFGLSGGWGILAREYGLGVDSIRSLRAVLADGAVVAAREDNEYADLFWALRGAGGGSYAVVTAMAYQFCPALDQVVLVSGQVHLAAMAATMVAIGKRDGSIPGKISFAIDGGVNQHGKTGVLLTAVGADPDELKFGEQFVRKEMEPLFPSNTSLSYDRLS